MRVYERILSVFFCHWISTLGVVVTTTSAVLFAGFQFTESDNPYYSLIAFIAVPATFLIGLVLIPAGLMIRARAPGGVRAALRPGNWDSPRIVRLAIIVLSATAANFALMSMAGYQAVEYMDSDEFCGTVCHVMEPQYEAYQSSAHAEVGCVECHIGPGAASFVSAKLEGVGRLAALVGGHDLPIRINDSNRNRTAATCTNCHREGARDDVAIRMIRHFDDDEPSTPRTTVLTMHTESAIHNAHIDSDIQYLATDQSRTVIPWTSARGQQFVSGETPLGDPQIMTCIDCHNRVGHEFETIDEALDRAIEEGRLDRSLPFVRRDAQAAIEDGTSPPAAAAVLQEIRSRNVYTEHDIDWDSYPRQIGHNGDGGCFRCHDGRHISGAGETVAQNCLSCHAIVAMSAEDPEIMGQLGLEP